MKPGWGENLYEAGDNPPSIPKDLLVYCPHSFGPSVYVRSQYMDTAQPWCEGLEGERVGDAEYTVVIDPALWILSAWRSIRNK